MDLSLRRRIGRIKKPKAAAAADIKTSNMVWNPNNGSSVKKALFELLKPINANKTPNTILNINFISFKETFRSGSVFFFLFFATLY